MLTRSQQRAAWCMVVTFAIAMAWVESACVYYLRLMVDRIQPYQLNPLPISGVLGQVELAREAATLVMLATVGALAGRTAAVRLAYTALAFGVWDIFYYVFLRVMSGWPSSLLDWDILFLIPLPWWGPVLAPMSIAVLMIVGGTIVSQSSQDYALTPLRTTLWRVQWLGMALALYLFMADALALGYRGLDVRQVLPVSFNWPLFSVALALMAAPLVENGLRMRPRRDVAAVRPAPVSSRS